MNTTGFPSPAQGYEEKTIDLNELAVSNKASTFFMRYNGKSFTDGSISMGDLLVVDCSLDPESGGFAILRTEEGFICCRVEFNIPGLEPSFFSNTCTDARIKNRFTFTDSRNRVCKCYGIFGVVKAVLRVFNDK